MKSNFFSPKIFLRLGGLCFMLMWIPFIVFMGGLFLYDAGSYKTYNEMPVVMLYSLPAIGLLFFFSFVFIIGSFVLRALEKKQLKKHGKPATAKILSLYETGSTIHQNPVVGFELEVYPSSGAIFRTKTEQTVRRLDIPKIQPNTEVKIKYHPTTRKVIIL